MGYKAAAEALSVDEEETEFYERLFIIDRMGREEQFMKDVVASYNAIKKIKYAWYLTLLFNPGVILL